MTKPTTPKNFVLYADDDADDLQLVRDSFAQYVQDVEVVTVSNGDDALAFLENLPDDAATPCLVILDVNMPGLDGKQVLARLRAIDRFAQVPVVLFTTSSLPSDKSYAQSLQAGFVTKPLNMKQMELITDQFISHCVEEVRRQIRPGDR
ncbi:MAG: response regulator [Flaviaesturariibacter sp.]|nr:response regulator [Flaviaesturariibacter sp.]